MTERATYTATEVCQLLDISDGLLRALMRSEAPPFREHRLGTAVRYPRAEVDAYLGRDGDGDAERRRRLTAHAEALLAAIAAQTTAVAAASAGLAELQGAVAALLAELAPAPAPVPQGLTVARVQAPAPSASPRRIAPKVEVAAAGAGNRRGPRPPNRARVLAAGR